MQCPVEMQPNRNRAPCHSPSSHRVSGACPPLLSTSTESEVVTERSFNTSTSAPHAAESESRLDPDQQAEQAQTRTDRQVVLSYEDMIVQAIQHHETLHAAQFSGTPFLGIPPCRIYDTIGDRYAHALPPSFKSSARKALKRARRKGLVIQVAGATGGLYKLNPDFHGSRASGRAKHVANKKKKANSASGASTSDEGEDTVLAQQTRHIPVQSAMSFPPPSTFVQSTLTRAEPDPSLSPHSLVFPPSTDPMTMTLSPGTSLMTTMQPTASPLYPLFSAPEPMNRSLHSHMQSLSPPPYQLPRSEQSRPSFPPLDGLLPTFTPFPPTNWPHVTSTGPHPPGPATPTVTPHYSPHVPTAMPPCTHPPFAHALKPPLLPYSHKYDPTGTTIQDATATIHPQTHLPNRYLFAQGPQHRGGTSNSEGHQQQQQQLAWSTSHLEPHMSDGSVLDQEIDFDEEEEAE
ncbi:hypothetical protein BCR44DRAFT_76206 [Catenaria anguillulae PL171]|uniref:H15 domain-containing protein n=1 Tax=Catenaria anguillulae PL171 TaxID=765915 RepID=A0A1Y2H733_9FUNG|nr:hypothetical protein BCR44DRAFT_76206 [Catenaria anguillulae PL171]